MKLRSLCSLCTEACKKILRHPRWLVAYTVLQRRGCLVKSKCPRAKGLSANALNTKAGLIAKSKKMIEDR